MCRFQQTLTVAAFWSGLLAWLCDTDDGAHASEWPRERAGLSKRGRTSLAHPGIGFQFPIEELVVRIGNHFVRNVGCVALWGSQQKVNTSHTRWA